MTPEHDVVMRMASSILRCWRDLGEREPECRQPPGTRMGMRGSGHLLVFEQMSAPNRVQPWRSVNADLPLTFISERRSLSVISAAVREAIGETPFPALRQSTDDRALGRVCNGCPGEQRGSGLTGGNGLAAADDARSFIGSDGPQGPSSLELRIWTAVQTRPSLRLQAF